MCACNPPYFTDGPQSQNAAHALARHEHTCTLDDVCQCAFRLLKDGVRFALCHRPERLAEVLAVLLSLIHIYIRHIRKAHVAVALHMPQQGTAAILQTVVLLSLIHIYLQFF